MMRLAGKIAVIVGAGQSPGEGIGNGRATVLRFAQEGAKILAVDRDLASAEETAVLAAKSGGEFVAFHADVTREATLADAMAAAVERWGRIDILHNNVGVSIAGGGKPLDEISETAFDRVSAINLRGTIMACKHVLPVMRRQRSGAIVNISSVAAYENTYLLVAYKATNAAMIAFTGQLALHNAPYGIPGDRARSAESGQPPNLRRKGQFSRVAHLPQVSSPSGAPPRPQRLGGALALHGPRKYVSTFFMSPANT